MQIILQKLMADGRILLADLWRALWHLPSRPEHDPVVRTLRPV